MTAPEPLTLTLREALERLDGMYMEFDSDRLEEWRVWKRKDERLTPNLGGVVLAGTGITWVEAVSEALGRPVVARDEAAPLTATDECSECGGPATAYSTNTTPPLCANCYHVNRRAAETVARDEAAELRAAVREFFKAEAAVAALYHPNGIYTDFYEAADIANAARENLRRLAASEGQP